MIYLKKKENQDNFNLKTCGPSFISQWTKLSYTHIFSNSKSQFIQLLCKEFKKKKSKNALLIT